ncbi:hypothetical protein ACFWMR_27495 [Amycolatopsis thailandensis]|uniref:Gram-positive cocci surface proteins LPxTG domain-containing protein n=1 Tax=Amycolatopsis thailandensis TaxID=589330 RepID=A0A229S981_9PSEU|nr:hypothetical protein [Amycolatopsis thailandensis]OXM55493.1 hypothetical protein CFP71_17510 [Amycolatopsis thailandensis]
MPTRSRLGRLAGLVAAGLIVCAPAAQAVEIQAPAPAIAQAATVQDTLRQPPPGPVLDPAETDKANSQETKHKIIAGVAAAILLGLVILGRRSRSKKKKS